MRPLITIILVILCITGCSQNTPSYYLDDFVKADYSPFVKIDNVQAKNPTLEELTIFLNEVEIQNYSCGHCAEELHNKAEAFGIRAAIVEAPVGENSWHAFNSFETLAGKKIYVDSTGGLVVIAEKIDDHYRITRYLETQTQIQELPNEDEFLVFW